MNCISLLEDILERRRLDAIEAGFDEFARWRPEPVDPHPGVPSSHSEPVDVTPATAKPASGWVASEIREARRVQPSRRYFEYLAVRRGTRTTTSPTRAEQRVVRPDCD